MNIAAKELYTQAGEYLVKGRITITLQYAIATSTKIISWMKKRAWQLSTYIILYIVEYTEAWIMLIA